VRPARHRFLTRNRLVAALSGATVVVEAGIRSGAASTAAWARALGRVVCAVPGPITSAASTGCHILLQAGAELVTRADEVREIIGRVGEFAGEQLRPADVLDSLTDTERRVYEALPGRGARTPDEIAVASGLPATEVLGPLAMLEIAGLIERHEGRWRLIRKPARSGSV
jgi:DNA processing protein